MLTEAQKAHFETFGFVVLRGQLSAGEVAALEAELEGALDAHYGEGSFDGTSRQWVLLSTPRSPRFAALLEDDRFYGIAAELMNDEVIGICAEGSRFCGDTTWHADTAGYDHWGIKLIFYFDALSEADGALRVVPGSHRREQFHAVNDYVRDHGGPIASLPAYVFASRPGDVLAYDVRLHHASAGGRPGRRGASVFYYHDPVTPEQELMIREQDRLSRAHIRDFRRLAGDGDVVDATTQNPLFDRAWLSEPTMSPRRRAWIERLTQLGFLDALDAPLEERWRLPHAPP